MKQEILVFKTITFNGPAIGLGAILLVLGFVIGLFSIGTENFQALFISLFFILLTIPCLLSLECLAIDKSNMRYKLYKDYLFFKVGDWCSINDFSAIRIMYKIDAPRQGYFRGAARKWNTTQFKYYDVYFIAKNKENLMVRHFIELKKAKELQSHLSQLTGLPTLEPQRILKK